MLINISDHSERSKHSSVTSTRRSLIIERPLTLIPYLREGIFAQLGSLFKKHEENVNISKKYIRSCALVLICKFCRGILIDSIGWDSSWALDKKKRRGCPLQLH